MTWAFSMTSKEIWQGRKRIIARLFQWQNTWIATAWTLLTSSPISPSVWRSRKIRQLRRYSRRGHYQFGRKPTQEVCQAHTASQDSEKIARLRGDLIKAQQYYSQ